VRDAFYLQVTKPYGFFFFIAYHCYAPKLQKDEIDLKRPTYMLLGVPKHSPNPLYRNILIFLLQRNLISDTHLSRSLLAYIEEELQSREATFREIMRN